MDGPGHPPMTERAASRTAPLPCDGFAFAERIDGAEAGLEPGRAPGDVLENLFDRQENLVVELDAGTYPIEAPIVVEGVNSVALVAKSLGDVTFEATEGFDTALLSVRDADRALVAGIDVDQCAPGATPSSG